MRKLVVVTFVTLDGIMQSPGAPEEDNSNGFEYGGWLVPHFDGKVGDAVDFSFKKNPDLVLGRKTYEVMAGYWPDHDDELPQINSAKKYVASTTLDQVDWNNSTLIQGDVASEIAQLKAMAGPELQVHGSSNLIQTLLANNLVDEFRLTIAPVVIGSGKRLFGEGTLPSNFRLIDSNASDSGVIIANYERTGDFQSGSLL